MATRNITRRLLLLSPFGIATALTVLMTNLQSERVAGYGFLFATPWAWLLDRGSFPKISNRALETLVVYVVLLWVPALLYSGCLWLLLRAFSYASGLVRKA
jgi:hypothetical protein